MLELQNRNKHTVAFHLYESIFMTADPMDIIFEME
jgi:hypothetical protein